MSDKEARAFGFYGSWREYAPIAFTNLLLIIVTLGFYRFWATTRTRHYLWSRTRFIDDRLEWIGTGKELFIGFLLVLVLLGIPFLILQFGVQALVIRGYALVGGCIGLIMGLLITYLGGIARYRALRYRLSRTYWHGIRGGSDDQGWRYGLSYMWKTFVGSLVLGLLIPWSMMSLWNERWNKLSYGPHSFQADGDYRPVFKRFLLFYLLPITLIILFIAFLVIGIASGQTTSPSGGSIIAGLLVLLIVLIIYGGLGIVALLFYSKFFSEAIGGLSLHTLQFHFQARSKDWFKLILGDIGLVIVTLGIGSIFLSYRHWKFFVTHLEASGEIDLSELTQSTTRTPGQGEGLLDAFDIGAI